MRARCTIAQLHTCNLISIEFVFSFFFPKYSKVESLAKAKTKTSRAGIFVLNAFNLVVRNQYPFIY